MRRQVVFVLMAVLFLGSSALLATTVTAGAPTAAAEKSPAAPAANPFLPTPELRVRNSCLQNPPPNCQFDPVCTANCSALYPKDPEARCECSLGCCMPID
jgi:hypothetical protein